MPSARSRLGSQGEQLAAEHLQAHGLNILARNFRTRYGEVDLVASEGDTIVFVEVRTRRSQAYGTPEESVTLPKRHWLALAAQQYLQDHGLDHRSWRIDLVAISMSEGTPAIRHHPGIPVEEPTGLS